MAGKFTGKAQQRVTTPAPKSMSDLLEPEDTPVAEPVKLPDAKKAVHIKHDLNEKLRLLVFQKRFTTERAAIEEGLRLLFKKEKI